MAISVDEMLGGPPTAPSVSVVPAGAGGENASLGTGAFDGASRFDSALALWSPPIQSVDADYLPERQEISGRTNDMLRNDAYVQGGAVLHKDNIVGSHYLLNARPATRTLLGKQDDKWEDEFQTEIEEKFELYADSSECWIDASRKNNLTELVRLGVGIHVAGGEMLASVEWLKGGGRPYSTAINMIDLARLSNDPKSFSDRSVRGGVRRDKYGAPIAYQVSTKHPADWLWDSTTIEWEEIPARKPDPWGRLQMIHLFEQVRPDQTRGIPEMAAALKEMKMTKSFRDITLQKAVTQALYAAVITSDLPSETVFQQLGAINPGSAADPEAYQEIISNYAAGFLGSVNDYIGKGLYANGVKVPHLFPGTKFDLLSTGKEDGRGMEFEQSLLRYIAATLGVSYEQLSRDYTNTNYSSARAAMSETWKFMQARKKVIADKFATIMYRLWLEEAFNKGSIDSITRAMKQPDWLYQNQRLEALSRCDWIGASRGQIDELKETQAAVLRINNGLSTAEDELARLGKDWRKVYRQLRREMLLRKDMELVFAATDQNMVNALSAEQPAEGKKA